MIKLILTQIVSSDFNIVCDSVHVYLTGLYYESAALGTASSKAGILANIYMDIENA